MHLCKFVIFFILLCSCWCIDEVTATINATLVGHWTFEDGNELTDLTGNFADIILEDGAQIANGQLDINTNNWARAVGNSSKPLVSDKTLVSWASLDDLEVRDGSILCVTVNVQKGKFDGIIYAETQPKRWLAGSNFYKRSSNPVPGYEETSTDIDFQLAISYETLAGNQARIVLYRNGELFGNYTKGTIFSWVPSDLEAVWGIRHRIDSLHWGVVDAHIEESRIYASVLTGEDLKRLTPMANKFACSKDAEGDLKLDNSTSPPLVMMCVQGKWGYICGKDNSSNVKSNSSWTLESVGVACQQLGYIRESSYVPVPELTDLISIMYPVHFEYIHCNGLEERLTDCTHGDTDIHHGHCKVDGVGYKYGAASCTTKPVVCESMGAIKLVNDESIQICSQGDWHSLCGDTWTSAAQAAVACRQLGLNPDGAIPSNISILNDEVAAGNYTLGILFSCNGSEESLLECSTSSVVNDCISKAAITCIEDSNTNATTTTTQHEGNTLPYTPTTLPNTLPITTTTIIIMESTNNKHSSTLKTTNIVCSASNTVEKLELSSFMQINSHWIAGLIIGVILGIIVTTLLCSLLLIILFKQKQGKRHGYNTQGYHRTDLDSFNNTAADSGITMTSLKPSNEELKPSCANTEYVYTDMEDIRRNHKLSADQAAQQPSSASQITSDKDILKKTATVSGPNPVGSNLMAEQDEEFYQEIPN